MGNKMIERIYRSQEWINDYLDSLPAGDVDVVDILKNGMSPMDLKLPEDLTFDQWRRIGKIISPLGYVGDSWMKKNVDP